MIKLRHFIKENPSGQVLLATLFFCFIFLALFVGLFKAGSSYIEKEKAMRSADLTALSVGAVYANGLQLVRYTNAALMVSAIIDVVTIAATEGAVDPKLRKVVQTVQSYIFGINKDTNGPGVGLYPVLMWVEGVELAGNNHLRNNWPFPPNKFQPPIPPLPMFFFNPETSDLQWMIIPSMRLKFRSAADLLNDNYQDEKVYYYHTNAQGQTLFYSPDQIEEAPNSQHEGQKRVTGKGNLFLRLTPVVTPAIGDKKGSLSWALKNGLHFLANIPLDVVHADDPHNHTVIVYDQLPGSQQTTSGSDTLNYHVVSEMKLVGGGLAAWNLVAGDYFKVRLISIDLTQFPKIRDFVSSIPGVPGVPSIPKVQDILRQVLHRTSLPGFPTTSGSTSGTSLPGIPSSNGPTSGPPIPGSSQLPGLSPLPQLPTVPGVNLPNLSQLPNLPQVPGVQGLSLPTVSQIPNIPGVPQVPGLPSLPSLSDIANFFGIDPNSLPEVPAGI